MRDGKKVSTKVHWLSPRFLSLLDYLLHKSPYWSISNYDRRVDENIRDGFMHHVVKVHKDSRQELQGLSC